MMGFTIMSVLNELPDQGSTDPIVPVAELPAFYRQIAERLRCDAFDPSMWGAMRDQIARVAWYFDNLRAGLGQLG
jgi:hypothetical protein